MKIGLLAYQSAINFGANLQIASTYGYLLNNGHTPIIINLVPEDLMEFYSKSTSGQASSHAEFIKHYCTLTRECHNAKEMANVIQDEGIEAVIIGSDAVAQHHPLLERIIFPTKTLFSIRKLTSDRMFPNPFWGTFADFLPKGFPMAVLSASNQDSSYKLISPITKKRMRKRAEQMKYISARDTWTQSMYNDIFRGKRTVPVTPDPVFAFNQNVKEQPSESQIREQFGLERDYVLLSFLRSSTVSEAWLSQFEQEANAVGIDCVALPFPSGIRFKNSLHKKISIPLTPIDWYCLIKYSKGYVGHNMHPIVVSLHNSNPFYSFDNYGRRVSKHFVDESTSKIKHILEVANMLDYRSSCCNVNFVPPEPGLVLDKLVNFDYDKAKCFSQRQTEAYNNTMVDILKSLK